MFVCQLIWMIDAVFRFFHFFVSTCLACNNNKKPKLGLRMCRDVTGRLQPVEPRAYVCVSRTKRVSALGATPRLHGLRQLDRIADTKPFEGTHRVSHVRPVTGSYHCAYRVSDDNRVTDLNLFSHDRQRSTHHDEAEGIPGGSHLSERHRPDAENHRTPRR